MKREQTSALPPLLQRDPTWEEELRQLWVMTATERVTAMRAGRMTWRQQCAWAARRPHEVPRLNGEFEFIAIHTPEVAETD
jgi:hypothetical protein